MTWVIFWSSVALALGALAWVTVEVIALEKRQAVAHIEAQRQESIRRALWRMDSRMAPILAIEASRPYTDYQPIVNANDEWLRLSDQWAAKSIRTVTDSNMDYANRYFEYDYEEAEDPAEQIVSLLNNQSNAPVKKREDQPLADEAYGFSAGAVVQADEGQAAPNPSSQSLNDSDFEARRKVADLASQSARQESLDSERFLLPSLSKARQSNITITENGVELKLESNAMPAPESDVQQKPTNASTAINTLSPRWIADNTGAMQLVLVRSAITNGKPVIQGVWLDWDALRNDLLEAVDDVMPESSLVPVTGPRSSMVGGYQLATIPVAFIPSANTITIPWHWSPATVGLLVTWIAIIATIIAVGIVLRAAIVLSERRGRFVSAVTHELRTPLTTFRLYSQMLADGMVSDEEVRTDYLQILKRESERLTGIVENVLEYARLTRKRSAKDKAAGVQMLSPGALIARFRPTLARRAGQSNLDLVVSMDLEAHKERTVTVDPHAVERIMMNLIENACKYAAPAEGDDLPIEEADTRIHLDITIKDNTLELLVADHGPGIRPGEDARIFGEFQRGWRGLSNARSGLGLGLALSRGLAREMEGDLVLTKRRGHGAEFLLTIPLDENASESSF
jgi:signal transduction histidine kinase